MSKAFDEIKTGMDDTLAYVIGGAGQYLGIDSNSYILSNNILSYSLLF